jgi:hypothetical protein
MRATLQAVMPYDLHGTRYWQLIFMPEGGTQAQQARLSHDMVYADPRPGDTIEVHAILSVIDRVSKVEEPASS